MMKYKSPPPGQSHGRSSLGKPGSEWEDTIKVYLGKNMARGSGLDSTGLRYNKIAYFYEHSDEPSGYIKIKKSLFQRRPC
jgi:hypothetical protein